MKYSSSTLIVALFLAGLSALEMPNAQARGGSNIGGSGRSSQSVSSWCRGALGVLDAAQSQAAQAMVRDDRETASMLLKQGLLDALSRDASDASLIHRSLQRGLEMSEALDTIMQGDARAVDASVFFLTRYYSFIFETSTLDMEFYIPYRSRPDQCSLEGCDGLDIDRFEQQFVTYAENQIEFVLKNFAASSATRVAPSWSAKAFLKLLELSTAYAAEDLTESLWALRFACVRERLGELNQRLAHYNAGNRAVFPSDVYAVNASYGDAARAARTLEHGCR